MHGGGDASTGEAKPRNGVLELLAVSSRGLSCNSVMACATSFICDFSWRSDCACNCRPQSKFVHLFPHNKPNLDLSMFMPLDSLLGIAGNQNE